MLVLLASLAIGGGQWEPQGKVPGYRLAFRPAAIAYAAPSGFKVSDTIVRDRRAIESWLVVKQPFEQVARLLARDMKPEADISTSTDQDLRNRGSLAAYRILPDRLIKASARRGRPVVTKGDNFISRGFQDEDKYTIVQIIERPLKVGPLPKTWPSSASVDTKLPKTFPGVPVRGLNRAPDSWACEMTPGGAMQYWMQWYVDEAGDSFFPKVIADLEKSGRWKVGLASSRGYSRSTPIKPSSFVWLDFEHYRSDMPDVPLSWSVVGVSWTDPASGPGRNKKPRQ